ncbi:MAG TPA: alpha/beta fold hydrolase, partial [Pilimelia sp.]|nr:alpha/beta fold hydrolase [Pilimelia sp.]
MSSRPTRPSLATAVSTVAAITVAAVALPINAAAAASRPALGPDRRTAVPDRPGTAALRWGPCPVDVAAHPAQRCADLSVPMDYRDPGGRPLTIRISRIPAADPARRLGTLVLSPGGPGIGGLDEPADRYREDEPAELRDRYDLVGFDGRGIRHSSPITCRLAGPVPLMRYPAPDGSITHTVAHARRAARSCERHAGDLLPHLTTANTARDLDRIRAALGEARISFKGLSYGTYLGAVYATLFPHRTDRVVLDSAVDPRRVWYDFIRLGGAGLAERLPDLTAWIAARPDTYRLGSTAGEVGRRYRAITAGLDAAPRPYPGVTIDGNWLRAVTREGLGMPGTAAFPVL